MNAVIYARYSSHSQNEQSIEGQLHDNYAWAEQQGINVIAEYIDRALSGTKDTRPDFQRMIADAAKRQFDMVIVWKLDRFARNRYDSAIYKAKLKKYNVRVVSVKENITDSPEGIILEGLLESMAEYYSANLSQNVKRGKRETAAKGIWGGGNPPFGYKVVDRKLVADEKQLPAVKYLFEKYAEGVPRRDIVSYLNEKGYHSSTGKPFTYKSFSRTLQNTVYIGQYVYGGEVIEGLAEQIIDNETFQKVQDKIKMNRKNGSGNKAKVEYLLRGKIFCGHCGSPMLGDTGGSSTGKKYSYYTCATRKHKYYYPDSVDCKKKNEKKDIIEQYVVEQTVNYVLDPDHASYIADSVVKEYKKEFSESGITEMKKTLSRLDKELDKLIDALISSPKIAHDKIHKRMEEIEIQKSDIEISISKMSVASSLTLTKQEVLSWLVSFCSGDPADIEYRRRIVDVLVNSVYVYDDKIVIFYNVRGGKQVSYTDIASLPDPDSSDTVASIPTNAKLSERQPYYVFVHGLFGCVFFR